MRLAFPHETDAVIAFYRQLMTENASSPYHPDWRVDIYPTNGEIADYVSRGQMYVLDDPDGGYLAAFALTEEPVDGYEDVTWQVDAPWEDTAVVHLLCVAHAHHGQGIGRRIVQELLDICQNMGKRAVRLDVMTKNLPAQRLYEGAGFAQIGQFAITYEDTGTMQFLMYEFDLSKRGGERLA